MNRSFLAQTTLKKFTLSRISSPRTCNTGTLSCVVMLTVRRTLIFHETRRQFFNLLHLSGYIEDIEKHACCNALIDQIAQFFYLFLNVTFVRWTLFSQFPRLKKQKRENRSRPVVEIVTTKIDVTQLKTQLHNTLLLIGRAYVVFLRYLQRIASNTGLGKLEKAMEIEPIHRAERSYVAHADLCTKSCAFWQTNLHVHD